MKVRLETPFGWLSGEEPSTGRHQKKKPNTNSLAHDVSSGHFQNPFLPQYQTSTKKCMFSLLTVRYSPTCWCCKFSIWIRNQWFFTPVILFEVISSPPLFVQELAFYSRRICWMHVLMSAWLCATLQDYSQVEQWLQNSKQNCDGAFRTTVEAWPCAGQEFVCRGKCQWRKYIPLFCPSPSFCLTNWYKVWLSFCTSIYVFITLLGAYDQRSFHCFYSRFIM